VNTMGFKRDRAVFQDLLYQVKKQPGGLTTQDSALPSGLQLGTGVRIAGTAKQFTQGSLSVTGQPLDLAIKGRGFFQILQPDGTLAYTRDGEFQLDSTGNIVTANGMPLSPAITVPPNTSSITIGQDGTVSSLVKGNTTPTVIGNIGTVDFVNPQGLEAVGGNLYTETGASGSPLTGTPGLSGFGTIQQGSLETSNVKVVEELVNMITTQRAYEMNSKVVSTADQMLQFITQKL